MNIHIIGGGPASGKTYFSRTLKYPLLSADALFDECAKIVFPLVVQNFENTWVEYLAKQIPTLKNESDITIDGCGHNIEEPCNYCLYSAAALNLLLADLEQIFQKQATPIPHTYIIHWMTTPLLNRFFYKTSPRHTPDFIRRHTNRYPTLNDLPIEINLEYEQVPELHFEKQEKALKNFLRYNKYVK